MPTNSNNPIPTVIHVRNQQAKPGRPWSANVEEWLGESGLDVRFCEDVYRGLAMILRTRDPGLRAVVVCVDDLRADEFEFFTLIARFRADLSVYVYGRDQASPRLARAIELGATGRATEAAIRSLRTERHEGTGYDGHEATLPRQAPPRSHEEVGRAVPADPSREREGAVSQSRERERVDENSHEATLPGQAPPRSHEEVNEEESPTIESPVGEHKESNTGVRVPWLRYGDRPARRGPESGRTDGASAELPFANAPGTRPDAAPSPQSSPWKGEGDIATPSPQSSARTGEGGLAYEPLLTEAELEALMNEDFDEFDPGGIDRDSLDRDEREMLTGDEAAGEGGRR